MATRDFVLPEAKAVLENPPATELQQLTAQMPNARRTAYGNLNVQTEVLARSKASTYPRHGHADGQTHQAIRRAEYERVAALQDAYIAGRDMVLVEGFIGYDPDTRTPARLYVERANANIAGMQQQLYFDARGRPARTAPS